MQMISSLKLPFNFDPAPLKADLAQFVRDDWVPHFNKAYYEGDWSVVALRSVGGAAKQIYPDPTAQDSFAGTEFLARCPGVRQVLNAFECPLQSVRFLKLAAGSSIREHRDYNLGYEDGEVRIHVPVLTNSRVEFYLAGEKLSMNEGESWYVNFNLPHRVLNLGETERVHLVIDCTVNDWLRDKFPAS